MRDQRERVLTGVDRGLEDAELGDEPTGQRHAGLREQEDA